VDGKWFPENMMVAKWVSAVWRTRKGEGEKGSRAAQEVI